MSNYTNTLSGTTDASPVLGTAYQTQFDAIKTALATKGNVADLQASDGTSTTDNWWGSDVATQLTAGYGESIVTLTPITIDGADEPLVIDAALGNFFLVVTTWVSGSGGNLILLGNFLNPIDGQEILLVVKRSGGVAPDVTLLADGDQIKTADNYANSWDFTLPPGADGRANLYRFNRIDGEWLGRLELLQIPFP